MVLRDRGDPGGRGGDPAVLGQSFRAAPSPGRQAPRRPADGRRRDAPGHPWSEKEGPSDDKLVQLLAWATARSTRPTRPLHVSVHGPGRLDEGLPRRVEAGGLSPSVEEDHPGGVPGCTGRGRPLHREASGSNGNFFILFAVAAYAVAVILILFCIHRSYSKWWKGGSHLLMMRARGHLWHPAKPLLENRVEFVHCIVIIMHCLPKLWLQSPCCFLNVHLYSSLKTGSPEYFGLPDIGWQKLCLK